jgi:SAM-dependent methyltransferase
MFWRQKRQYRRLGDFTQTTVGYNTSLVKEEVARDAVFGLPGNGLRFLDVGAGDRELRYLLGIRANLELDEALYASNRTRFDAKFSYVAHDLESGDITGDICAQSFPDDHANLVNYFDVVYSNNVFEHLRRPWVAAKNIVALLRPGGIAVTIAPFALRYHEVPADYFRYTHAGLAALFEDAGARVLVSGYDITGRRNDWQGGGLHNDVVPVDELGAWRENWFVVTVAERSRRSSAGGEPLSDAT